MTTFIALLLALTSSACNAADFAPTPQPQPSPSVTFPPIPPVTDVPPITPVRAFWNCEFDPQVTGYRIYWSPQSGVYTLGKGYACQVDASTCYPDPVTKISTGTCSFSLPTLENIYLVATAINMNQTDPDLQESDPSLEIVFRYPVPAASASPQSPNSTSKSGLSISPI